MFQIRASIRTINPKEKKYMQSETKFKRQVFVRNVMRLKTLIMCVIDFGKYLSYVFCGVEARIFLSSIGDFYTWALLF